MKNLILFQIHDIDWTNVGGGLAAVLAIAGAAYSGFQQFFKKKPEEDNPEDNLPRVNSLLASTEEEFDRNLENAFKLIDQLQKNNDNLVRENERLWARLSSVETRYSELNDRYIQLAQRVHNLDGEMPRNRQGDLFSEK